ncbi:MAG: aspartate-semialdehyde dehydrogenase, partial [Gammaproteobacteria bacterium]|nr:aspartate-semialdehyde dehydrogenase [Gammaproteobacteria bacterium]
GETLLEILAERHFPIAELYPLASERSQGESIIFGRKPLLVENVAQFDFNTVDLAFFMASNAVALEYAPRAAEAGCIVIDNSSAFRYDADVPLIVPEVNSNAIEEYRQRNIIANPNCSTIQMAVALKPIYDAVGIARINVTTYQSVSGAGRGGLEELAQQTQQVLNAQPLGQNVFSRQIAFNVIPQIDPFQDNGYTREEMKMVWETQKIFADDSILVNPTAVRVPVFFGHSEAINIETRAKISASEVYDLMRNAPGIIVTDPLENDKYPTPVMKKTLKDAVYVGRIREDISHPHGINLWVVADNVRKGAALNAVEIAELLL